MLAPVLGERSVLVLDRDEHLQARKRLLPPFHGERLSAADGETDRRRSSSARSIAGRAGSASSRSTPACGRCTLEAILRAVFGRRARAGGCDALRERPDRRSAEVRLRPDHG